MPRSEVDLGLNRGKFNGLNELVTPYWVLDPQGGGWKANEPDPDWNSPVGDVGKVLKHIPQNDQQGLVREAGESRAYLLGQEGHSRTIDGSDLI